MPHFFSCLNKTCLLVLFCICYHIQAQNGGIANNWYFGNHYGLNFNTGNPTLVSGPIATSEGVAAVSDVNGNLLFSTDGTYVYNKNNLQMPNGFGLWGHPSASQSAIIVPDPGNTNRYYVFTVEATAGSFMPVGDSGVAYSIVDLTLNGGLGDVITKNVSLVHPAPEKLTAVRHCNGTDYWVLCHGWNSDAFYAYQITPTGVNAPVISHIGAYHYSPFGGNSETLGYIKFSPNGQKLVAVRTYVTNSDIEIFDFDNATGILSNLTNIPSPGGGYGISFSPDNTKLYIGSFFDGLLQYDLTAPNIAASLYVLDGSGTYGAVQLGPDGKIYTVPYNTNPLTLGLVSNPNAAGASCNYNAFAFTLPSGNAFFGLPNFPDNIIASTLYIGPDVSLCDGDSLTLQAKAYWENYLWSTGDTTQSINVNQAGTYWVAVTTSCGNLLSDTIIVYPPSLPVDLGNDTAFACNINSITLYTNAANASTCSWSTGAVSPYIVVNNAGTYWVNVTDACGSSTDTIVVSPFVSALNYVQDTFFCKSANVSLNAAAGYANYEWNTGANTQNLVVSQVGIYYVNMTDNNGCIFIDSVMVTQNLNFAPNAFFATTNTNNVNGTFSTTIAFTSTVANEQHFWDFGDGTSDTAAFPAIHIYPCGSNYLITHIVSNECGTDTFYFTIDDGCHTANIENSNEYGILLYPNPITDGTFYIEIDRFDEKGMRLDLYDMVGKCVYSKPLAKGENYITLDKDFPNGIYLARIACSNPKNTTFRILVMGKIK